MALRRMRGAFFLQGAGLSIVLVWTGLFLLPAADAAPKSTILKGIRSSRHAEYSRIVLELEGERPLTVGPLSDQGFPVVFSDLKSRLSSKTLKTRWPQPVASISIEERDGSTLILVGFGEGTSSAKDSIVAKSNRAYRLVLDFGVLPPGSGPPPKSGAIALPGGKEDPSAGAHSPHGAESTSPATSKSLDHEPHTFARGDALFSDHMHDLAPVAAQIIEEYRSALRDSPKAPQAVAAHFRSGLCHLSLGDAKKAEESFKQVLNNHSQHPIAPLAWMRLGEALLKRQAYIESIQALRTALNAPLEKRLTAEANYLLGKGLYLLGAHKEALGVLVKSLEDDPSGHVANPDLLRTLGEAYFVNQEYEKSAMHLMWYLNLEKEVAGKDLLLAKIGESLMYTGDQDMAKKIYVYIDKYFPDTEGYVISKIRRAEYFERQSPPNRIAAAAIYEELSQRSLTGPVGEFLTFKVASWERERKNYPRALEWIGGGLQNSSTAKAKEELLDLKAKVLLDFIRDSHANQDHTKALQLYQDNRALLDPQMSGETLSLIAESCAMLKLHPAAAEIYQRLYTQSGAKSEEWLLKAARCYFQMRDSERTILSCQPLQGESYQREKAMMLGRAYFEERKYGQAAQELLKHIQKTGKLEETDPEVLFCYAESLILSDKAADALPFLDKLTRVPALAEGEDRIRIGLMQSRCHHALKQTSQATDVLEHLLTISPPEALRDRLNYELSRLYLETGQPRKATEKLTQLAQTSNGLWKTAAEQELGYLELQGHKPKEGSK